MARPTLLLARLSHPAAGRGRGRRGTTLLELAVVAAIVSVMAGIAVPRFGQSMTHYRARAAANRVAADLAMARTAARTGSASRTLAFDALARRYTLDAEPDLDHRRSDAYGVDLGLDPYLVSSLSAAFTPVGGGATTAAVTFDRYGTPDASGTVVVRVGNVERSVALDAATGRARVQ